jgi:electron-transferring-flavoprotein dehydrogenase
MWLNTLFGVSPVRHAEARQDRRKVARAGFAQHKKIAYPKPDGVLTFDRLSSVFLSVDQS